MAKNVVLLRVGIDSGSGGIQGPLFEDGTFEFICIPDNKRVSIHTYGSMIGRDGKPLIGYFAESRRKVMAEQHVHVDPEFETFTYGDPTTPKRSLRHLKPGDLLVFYCAEGRDRAGKPLKVLSPKMQKVFGDFGGHVSIQRSPPRWVEPAFVDKAVGYLKGLQ